MNPDQHPQEPDHRRQYDASANQSPPYGVHPTVKASNPPPNPYGAAPNPYGPGSIPASSDPYSTPGGYPPPPPYVAPPGSMGQSSPYGSPPPTPPPTQSNRRLLFVALAMLLLVVIIGAVVIVPVVKTQTDHAHATATVSTKATGVAATAQSYATATATVTSSNADPYPDGPARLLLYDPLNQPGNNLLDGTKCGHRSDGYHITAQKGAAGYCEDPGQSFVDFAYDVKMRIVKGDCGGLIFRIDDTEGQKDYLFAICQDSANAFDVAQGASSRLTILGNGLAVPSFHKGLGQTNTLGVAASGPHFSLYINQQFVASFTDSTYGSGKLGVVANDIHGDTEVVFQDMRIWSTEAT